MTQRLSTHLVALAVVVGFSLVGCAPATTDLPKDGAGAQGTVVSVSNQPEALPGPVKGINLRLLVVDQPELAQSLEQAKADWKSLSGSDLAIEQRESHQIAADEQLVADVIVAPAWFLAWAAERQQVQELPAEVTRLPAVDYRNMNLGAGATPAGAGATSQAGEEPEPTSPPALVTNSSPWAWQELYPLLRGQLAIWNNRAYCVPLGDPIPVLIYRQDLLNAAGIKVPRTWEEFDRAAMTLQGQRPATLPADQPWSGALEPLSGASAGVQFLARAAAYLKHPDYYTSFFDLREMKAQLASPATERALQELVKSAERFPASKKLAPHEVGQALLAGEAALGIGWFPPLAASKLVLPDSSVDLAFAPLPGSRDVFHAPTQRWERRSKDANVSVTFLTASGPVVMLSKKTSSIPDALRLMSWLSNKDSTWGFKSPNGGPSRYLQRALPNLGLALPQAQTGAFLDAMEQSLQNEQALAAPRILNHPAYMQALNLAVYRVIEGIQTPAEALPGINQAWDKLTQEVGMERQRSAYEHGVTFIRE